MIPLHKDDLDRIVKSKAPRDFFGPGTDYPCLVLDLDGTDTLFEKWVTDLPCPVIGIGKGGLSKACDVVLDSGQLLERIITNIRKAPIASMILVQHLRASEKLEIKSAVTAESFAYGTVQQGPEFKKWLSEFYSESSSNKQLAHPLFTDTEGSELNLVLSDPDNRNAIGVVMRDAICEALDLALADDSIQKISLSAEGSCFSTGGKVEEFGIISDPATAHWVRSLRLPAWYLARLHERLQVHVHGGVIGAGVEIAAFGNKVTAAPDAWFQLPELKYGLIPGAGGTVSLPRRIGRQNTAYLALSMKRISAQTALRWGLIDEIFS